MYLLQVVYVMADHNNITLMDLGWIESYPNLVGLNLSSNNIKTLTNSKMNNLHLKFSLELLDLSDNNLQVIQMAVLFGLTNLRTLNLSNNQIHSVIQVGNLLSQKKMLPCSNRS